jgi:hypothetical protein
LEITIFWRQNVRIISILFLTWRCSHKCIQNCLHLSRFHMNWIVPFVSLSNIFWYDNYNTSKHPLPCCLRMTVSLFAV